MFRRGDHRAFIGVIAVLFAGCANDVTDGPMFVSPPVATPLPANSMLACDPRVCEARGQLCEGDGCVDPWTWGSPVWSTCPDETRATPETLAEKAAIYDARMMALHVSPQMPWVIDVALVPGTDPVTATSADVGAWWSGENDGLFDGLAIGSQAYRYAVTRSPEALENMRVLLEGERLRMRVTGVSGLFTRQLIPPGVPGIACPEDPAMYVPSPEKRGNKWVRIGDDGCAQVTDEATLTFHSTTHCGLDDFRGWCFLDNVSQDEYVGHMFGLTAVARLVDDPSVRDVAVGLLREIGEHVVANDMEFVDWDGRPTQWGKIHPGAFGDTDGYLAVMGMSFLSDTAAATRDPGLLAAYDRIASEYPSYLDRIDIWTGPEGCTSNWNNVSMLSANFHHLLWNQRAATRRAPLVEAFDEVLMRPTSGRAALAQHNAWFDIMWAAQKPLGPGTDGPAYAAVEDAVCQLRQFPASNHVVARDPSALSPDACEGRSGESLSATAFEVADRCAATFVWWGNPYTRETCTDAPNIVKQPTGYLLPYWMARYYGFVSADQ